MKTFFLEKEIQRYIDSGLQKDKILQTNHSMDIASYFGDWIACFIAWYPIKMSENILQIGSWYGAFSEFLCMQTDKLTIVEEDRLRYEYTQKRLKQLDFKKILYSNLSLEEFCASCNTKYDYIIWAIDELHDTISSYHEYLKLLKLQKSLLTEKGTLLFALPNRFGFKYLCGEQDESTGIPFGGITDNNTGLYRMDQQELIRTVDGAGFKYRKLFYPISDMRFTQVVYTDEFPPNECIRERLHIFLRHNNELVLDEARFVDRMARNGNLNFFSNSFFVVANDIGIEDISFAAITGERPKESAFATRIYREKEVIKVPVYTQGKEEIANLVCNHHELKERKIPVLPIVKKGSCVSMDYIKEPTLSEYIKNNKGITSEELKYILTSLWEMILRSSEHVDSSSNKMIMARDGVDYGVILEKAYIEMIPVNCFWKNGSFIFFDQEFAKVCYPAGYVMYRVIRDVYFFSRHCESVLPIEEAKASFKLMETWDDYEKEENLFQEWLRNRNIYRGFWDWIYSDPAIIKKNRNLLSKDKNDMNNIIENDFADNEIDIFDSPESLGKTDLIVFGTGVYADYYMEKYGSLYAPKYFVDNNKEKWGEYKFGIPIVSPDKINDKDDQTGVIIAIRDYAPVLRQLRAMGLTGRDYRIFSKRQEELFPFRLIRSKSDELYDVGYVTGAFDLFHIGHLNVLRNSKSRCHYLIAGVLTDEIIEKEKHKTPFIPFEERIEIVRQCKYVDRVVAIDSHNTDKIDAWRELRYGCLFSGSDHIEEDYWLNLRKELQHLGSNLEFFPYTKSTSSTMLQQVIRKSI